MSAGLSMLPPQPSLGSPVQGSAGAVAGSGGECADNTRRKVSPCAEALAAPGPRMPSPSPRLPGSCGRSKSGASPPLPPVTQTLPTQGAPCCHFAGHPAFCCRAEALRGSGPPQHVVRLERRPGADRLGFGNVAAGPRDAPVLVVSWVREGALAAWNEEVPEDLQVPAQSAIVSVNGVSRDVQRMREELREQVIEMVVIAPDRWKWNKAVSGS